MRAGIWDFLCVLKPENILHLLSHASLPCNDVYIRTCQHARVQCLQLVSVQYLRDVNGPPSAK
jgi:hypothetical protein